MKNFNDLTTGSVTKQLIRFAIPLFLANLLQSFYNIVDMLVVGRIVGSTGVAAISNASSLVFIINAICMGITMGGTVMIAQYRGAKDAQGQKRTVGTIYSMTTVIAVMITIAGLLLNKQILTWMNVPKEAYQDACEYMLVIFIGTIFVFGYNATCSILRGFGDSKSPLYFVMAAAAINVFLDYLLVGPFKLGTVGAAYATIIAQAISFGISVIYLKKQNFIFDFKLSSFKIEKDTLFKLLKVSLPTAIQMTVVNISYLIIAVMINDYGVITAAAAGIGLKINTFAGMPCWAIGQAVTTMVGQSMGAKLLHRTKRIAKTGFTASLLISLAAVVCIQLFAEPLIGLFDSSNKEVLAAGVIYLRICCCWNSLFYATMYNFDSFAVGVGFANLGMVNALLDALLIRLPLCWFLGTLLEFGVKGIYWAQALSPIIPACIGLIYFLSKKWYDRRLV
ncbi:MATE family efflux transporter [Enterococcus sp.]|uniref:MATE family efflux transporter n=1 Tax=Enterococcus sp. TaxID=35783 RepID=UPI00290C52BB|nr:MATE family efflux transporter [Enterococcus sp.]MDU5335372.1 MATE family efflux transporter [Enterococcus sp.]